MNVYSVLEVPWIYDCIQWIFGSAVFTQLVRERLQEFSNFKVLELGSGTGAFTQVDFESIYASDINRSYLESIPLPSSRKLVLDASSMEDLSADFDLVYSVGLYHHLSDDQVRDSLKMSFGALRTTGKLLVIDNIWPTGFNPFAFLVRWLDRGRYVRSRDQLLGLVGSVAHIDSVATGKYSWCNLEYVILECSNGRTN